MSIFQSAFKEGVKNQLKARQEAIIERTPQTLQYYNSRNSWIRVTSSVNVAGTSTLANKYVLQGGILDPNKNLRAGIGGTDSAYSNISPDGQLYRLGIRPMPGITGVEIKSKSAYGSLREATVSFVAWDIRQLEELELLYMRPGYSVLVEWGWAPYLDNNKNLRNTVNYISDDILKGGITKEEVWKKSFAQASTDGNYDSLYGLIKNYSWSARADGGYDCTSTIISIGEVVESLKVNYGTYATSVNTTGIFNDGPIPRPFKKGSPIERSYAQNVLAGICNELYLILKNKLPNLTSGTYKGWNFFRFDVTVAGRPTSKESDFDDNAQIYITLKDFFDVMNKHVLLSDSQGGSKSGNPKPMVELTTVEGEHMVKNGTTPGELLCLGSPLQLSTNPTVCFIKNKVWADPASIGLTEGFFSDFTTIRNVMTNLDKNYWYNNDYEKTQLGIIGNIYVNLSYIYSLVVSEEVQSGDRKEKNDIALFDFLKNLMSGINTAIGNVATFDIFTDPVDGKVRVIDLNYTDTRERDTAYNDAFVIETHNLKATVRSYKLESQIFPEQTTIVAIGAQAEGGALGEDVNTLIDFNQNLTDRIIPKKEAPTSLSTTQTTPTDEEKKKAAEEKVKHLKESLDIILNFVNEIDPDWWERTGDYDVGEASKYSNALKDIINFWKTYVVSDNKNRSLIPTKLSLELDGIGGMIIGNLFRIPEELLPRGYKGDGVGPAKIAYTITGLGHSLQNNDWITKIDAQFILLDEPNNKSSLTVADIKDITILNRALQKDTEEAIQIVQKKEEQKQQQLTTNIPAATGAGSINYMKQAGNAVFRNSGKDSRCAQYTYNIARDYVSAIRNKPVRGLIEPAGGNANDAAYRARLVALGYTMYSLGVLTKQQLISKINGSWNIGDIINYRSVIPVGGNNYANRYGHTQIYTGRAIDIGGKHGGGSNRTPWASSWADNYGVNFVYNSKNSNSWETYIFKAPT